MCAAGVGDGSERENGIAGGIKVNADAEFAYGVAMISGTPPDADGDPADDSALGDGAHCRESGVCWC